MLWFARCEKWLFATFGILLSVAVTLFPLGAMAAGGYQVPDRAAVEHSVHHSQSHHHTKSSHTQNSVAGDQISGDLAEHSMHGAAQIDAGKCGGDLCHAILAIEQDPAGFHQITHAYPGRVPHFLIAAERHLPKRPPRT